MTRKEEGKLKEIYARWEAVCDVLDGEEVSDFMLSFSEVRRVADLVALGRGHVYSSWTTGPHDGQVRGMI